MSRIESWYPRRCLDSYQDGELHLTYEKQNNKQMKKSFFTLLAKLNKALLPSYSKKQLDLAKASKFQLAIIGWRYYVTTRALG